MNPLPATCPKTHPLRGLAAAVLLVVAAPDAGAAPSVTNIRSFQQPGTKLVHIDYDLGGSGGPFWVSVHGSADGGATWTLPLATLAGKVGTGIAMGTNLRITWNAGADWNGNWVPQCRARVTAFDGTTLPAPPGMAHIAGGPFRMGDELDSDSGAMPVHTVQVDGFNMDKTEVSKELWQTVHSWGMANG
nr:SUMF1/EgtB/PvdO family nonheme iron enzyme [Akkermansiaceae bacterium]